MKKKIGLLLGVIVLVLGLVILYKGLKKESGIEKEKEELVLKKEDLKELMDKEIISGLEDIEIEVSTGIDLKEQVNVNDEYVENVEVDDHQVCYDEVGEYNIDYTFEWKSDKLKEFLKEENIVVDFDLDQKAMVSIQLVIKEKEEEEEVVAEDESEVSEPVIVEPEKPIEQPVEQKHEHKWVDFTITQEVWVPKVDTVEVLRTVKVAKTGDIICNCGARFKNTDIEGHKEHVVAHILANEPDNFHWDTVWVDEEKLVSEQVDNGHYETQTIVLATYCEECGTYKE